MINRLKTILLNTLAGALMLVPAMPAVVSAQDSGISNNLCNGANLSVDPDAPCTSDGQAAQDSVPPDGSMMYLYQVGNSKNPRTLSLQDLSGVAT